MNKIPNNVLIPFRDLNTHVFLILLVSLTFVILISYAGNLYHYVYADINFAAVGDWGCTSSTDATVTNINGKSPTRVFGLGDYSYASTGSCWFTKISPIDTSGKIKIAIGNHENGDNEGFSGYMSHFGLSQTYYSFNDQNVHVLVMDTDRNSFSSGSSQFNFVKNDLQSAAANPNIDWIIVYLHKPLYVSPNGSNSWYSNTLADLQAIRGVYHTIFDQNGVDLVLAGHVHDYQRTFPLKYNSGSPSNPIKTSSNTNDYIDPEGEIYAIVGTGGVGLHPVTDKASFVSNQQDDFFGQLDIKVTDNGNKLEGKFYKNGDNSVLDTFTITKAANSAPVADNQVALTGKDTAKRIAITASDPDNNPLTYSIVASPQHGTITGGTGQVRTYTPTAGYTGPDSFTFRANDGTVNSNTATVSITVVDPASCPGNLPVSSVFASGNDGNVPANVLDNNLNTRWSNTGQSWIAGDLGSLKDICSVDIAWYLGNQREYAYLIVKSNDGNTWVDAFSGSSTVGTTQVNRANTANSEKNFIPSTNARYIGIIAAGLSNTLVGITEFDIFSPTVSLSGSYQYDPSLSLSGPPN